MFALRTFRVAAPLFALSLTASLPSYAKTPLEKARQEEINKTKKSLHTALTHLTLPATRSTLAWATNCRGLAVGLDEGPSSDPASLMTSILRPFAWLLLPAAMIYDTIATPIALVASPILIGEVAFKELRDKIAPISDSDNRASEWKLLSEALQRRSQQAETLIGKRRIKREDLLAFTLGFTVVHSHYMSKHSNSLFLVNEAEVKEEDITLFPPEAAKAFSELVKAKHNVGSLSYRLQMHYPFMEELVARMTVEKEEDFAKVRNTESDTMDQIIEHLRTAAVNIQSVVNAMTEDQTCPK